jgi:hypothetical protein
LFGYPGTCPVRVRILDEAERDLFDGFLFHETQDRGLGDYFFDSLSADIESALHSVQTAWYPSHE